MVDIIAVPIADSIRNGAGDNRRLLTIRTRAPKFIHQETLRHRKIYCLDGIELWWEPDFSFSVSSSRAIPFARMLAEARDPALRAAPVYWGEAQKGMSPGAELDDEDRCIWWPDVAASIGVDCSVVGMDQNPLFVTKRECAKRLWNLGGDLAARVSEVMVRYTDVHKSIANRMVENYIHANVLMSGTDPGWLNFFGLRLDGAADPTLRALAERCWVVWNESQPRKLESRDWHLPYADDVWSIDEASVHLAEQVNPDFDTRDLLAHLQRMSVARCAHLSYEAFDAPGERMSVEKCLEIYQRLVGSIPIHASPAEHQSTPDTAGKLADVSIEDHVAGRDWVWLNPKLAGNLGPGWIQLRKTLLNEAVAPLPELYR